MKSKILFIIMVFILFFNAYILSYKYSFYSDTIYQNESYLSKKDNLVTIAEEVLVQKNNSNYKILDSYEGTMTAYGADCLGCTGITASGYDINNDNIHYEDKTFGILRIVAADRSVPSGTVVRVKGLKIYEEPILAIVLDRGGVIKGTLMDLAFGFQDNLDVKKIGRSNVVYDILRYGW